MSVNVQQNVGLAWAVERQQEFLSQLDRISGSLANVGQAAMQATNRIQGMLRPVQMAIGAGLAAFGTSALVSVNSQFENLEMKMAQTLRFMGVSTGTFAESLSDANLMINRIEASAARLPGSAQDYSTALQYAGVHAAKATGDFETAYKLIQDMTAVGASMGHSGQETALILEQALDTQRGMLSANSAYTISLVNAMRQLPGHAHITANEFNKMKLEKRLEIMQGLVGQYDDMIEASQHTWDAVAGAAQNTLKTVARLSSAQMFEGIKNAVSALTSVFQDGDGKLTHMAKIVIEIGNVLGGWVGAGLERMAAAVSWIGENALRLLRSLETNPLFAAMDRVYSGIAGVFENATTIVSPAIQMFSNLFDILSNFANTVLPPVLDIFGFLATQVVAVAEVLLNLGAAISEYLAPPINAFIEVIGGAVAKLRDLLIPVIGFLGHAYLDMYDVVADYLQPAFEGLAEVLSFLVDGIKVILNDILDGSRAALAWLGVMDPAQRGEDTREDTQRMRRGLNDLLERIRGVGETDDRAGREMTLEGAQDRQPHRSRGGGKTVQDFRHSRFEIQQKFEEGFDPDRIAVAFASDLARVGEQRLQSGMEPLFGLR